MFAELTSKQDALHVQRSSRPGRQFSSWILGPLQLSMACTVLVIIMYALQSSLSMHSGTDHVRDPTMGEHVRTRFRRTQPPRIAVAITTSRRPLLFRRAMLSFRTRCLDCFQHVHQWFAVDDGSSVNQLKEMQQAVPGLTWLPKRGRERGHVGSLNVLVHALRRGGKGKMATQVKDEDFVQRSLAVLMADPAIGQIVFNERYMPTDLKKHRENMVGGVEVTNKTSGELAYIVHEYAGDVGTPEWDAFFERFPPGSVANAHWPHFSLNW